MVTAAIFAWLIKIPTLINVHHNSNDGTEYTIFIAQWPNPTDPTVTPQCLWWPGFSNYYRKDSSSRRVK